MLMEKTPGCKNKKREYSITLEDLALGNGETDGESNFSALWGGLSNLLIGQAFNKSGIFFYPLKQT